MKPTKLLIIALFSLFMIACEHPTVSVEKEKAVIDALYECLELTPNQTAGKMETMGYHSVHRDTSSAVFKYDAYVDLDMDNPERILIGVSSINDTISQIGYNIIVTNDPELIAHYALIFNKIATYGYSDWHGYYEDSASDYSFDYALFGEYTADAKIVEDHEDLRRHINKECLDNPETLQYYAESFVYTHSDKSQWHGQLVLYGQKWGQAGGKDVYLSYTLIRIK